MLCTQCPRRCGAQRLPDVPAGVCAMPETAVVARAALHFWEEPPISGVRGSGTVFFSGCNLRSQYQPGDSDPFRSQSAPGAGRASDRARGVEHRGI